MRTTPWKQLADGDSDQWLWIRETAPRVFQFLEVTDMHSATGDTSGEKWVAELSEVDLGTVTDAMLAESMLSWGLELNDEGKWQNSQGDESDFSDAGKAEILKTYGHRAPLFSEESGNRRTAERAARREAQELARDADRREAALDRPVNALGSTAREYARGDLSAALSRGLAEGRTDARIMAQMQAPLAGTAVATIQLGAIPSNDPLAYLTGYQDGFAGAPMPEVSEDDSLAPAYLEGRKLGADVRAGKAPRPEWLR